MAIEETTDDQRERGGKIRRWFGLHAVSRAMWLLNFALLAALIAWILFDGKFVPTTSAVKAQFPALFAGISVTLNPAPQLGPRPFLLLTLCAAALLTALGVFIILFAGAASHRRLRSWFAFTLLVAAWLTLFVSWHELAWQGQRLRVRSQLAAFEPIAESLRANWPTRDGDRPQLGSFMAYPQGNPRTLLMLALPESPGTRLTYSAVERGDDGTLHFDLTGDNAGTWLEWHPAGSTPQTFTGGLEGNYGLRRAAPLGRGWYLVRYR